MKHTELTRRINRIMQYLKDEYKAPCNEAESKLVYKFLKNVLLRGQA